MTKTKTKTKILLFIILFLSYIFIYNYFFSIEKLTNADGTTNPNPDASCDSDQLEPTCETGPRGEKGASGGIYSNKGPLRNLNQINMVADRFDCFGEMANAYLSERSYKPQQTWTLNSSQNEAGGTLENQYGGCLNIDKLNNIYVTTPANCSNSTKWIFTSQGTLSPVNDKTKCLTYTNAGSFANIAKAGLTCTKGGNGINPLNNLLKLSIADCNNTQPSLTQQWAFS